MGGGAFEAVRDALWAAAPLLLCLAAALVALEQLTYIGKKGRLPGPTLVVPFVGSAVQMILNPTRFWDAQAAAAKSGPDGLSANYLIGRFIVFVRSTELSHLVFSNVRPDAFHLIGHPFGKKLFGEHNLIYMFGDEHKDLRRRISPNFTPKALSTYIDLQQKVISAHLERWLALAGDGEPIKLRLLCRDLNLETSQTVFVGPYLSPEARRRFNEDYNLFNVGLLAAPFDLPGFAFRRARLAVNRLAGTLGGCAAASRAAMLAGGEPACLVDFWMQESIRETSPPANSGDEQIGGYLFDFLFAAQDASTSSLLWAVSLLESHPEVLNRVRSEVAAVWSPGEPISGETVRGLSYTEKVVREVLRLRPPATMVPHVAGKEFRLTDGYVVPKGAIVFPSAFESSFQGFSSPERFDPERFDPERGEERENRRNFLAFGAGPHQCVGQRYAVNHLVLFVAIFVSVVDFRRCAAAGRDDIAYVPTIVPKDDCHVYLSRRDTAPPTQA